ncbi:MAG: hypothetical protein ACI9EW_000486 [Cellvibrionaceae bacterium]|jgi:hypothetical protein
MQFIHKWRIALRLFTMATALVFLMAACSSPPNQVEEPVESVRVEPDPVDQVDAEPEPTASELAPATTEPETSIKEIENVEVSAATEKGLVDTSRYDDYEIITLLPQDAIPAIDNPTFHTADEADDFYDPDELVMGVVFNGDARAYSVPHLSSHEIVNDEVGGVKIAVTW